MGDELTSVQWREKINPVFVIGIQLLKFLSRLFNNLELDQDFDGQATKFFIEFCQGSLQFLPETDPENGQIEEHTQGLSRKLAEEGIFSNPEVCHAMAELGARGANVTPELLKMGFARPHWWMRYSSWSDLLKTERLGETFLNLWSLLHFQIPLAELTQRVTEGDHKLYAKLFRFEGNGVLEPNTFPEGILKSFDDRATQIVGRALLLRGEPQGHQLRLRMTLFFGWDFGLADLSINELHGFLTEMQIIPKFYDPETLRKFRNRMRHQIKNSSKVSLLQPSS
ncbi:MAG: hypothetical protein DMG65_19570 [Candidatus Angelobacter sp. Gp1-AA117]|nr:MAG: hypothetical protein DMG65_19570 [Candidatus Angelobacter sp. Gp1-AA117]